MTVFVVQKQMKMDHDSGELVPRFPSINKAEKWGKLHYLLSPSANPFKSEGIITDLQKSLGNFSDEDYLVLIGNPILIGITSAIAAYHNEGNVNFLQWSGRENRYIEIKTRIK